MAKKRVYELAKEYGLDGREFASKLRELGFDKVKTHMAVLDDFDLMMIQARLEASGLVPEKAAVEAPAAVEEAKTKKKGGWKKRAEDLVEAEAPTVPPEAVPETKQGTEGERRTEPDFPSTSLVVEEAKPEIPSPAPSPTTPGTPGEAAVTKPSPAEPEKREEPVAPAKAPKAPPKPPLPEPKPALPRRTATILGRIDPSLLGTKTQPPKERSAPAAAETAPAKPRRTPAEEEADRIAARLAKTIKRPHTEEEEDQIREALAEVHPTFEHDARKTLTRGDAGARQHLTGAQLMAREEARYQRRRDARRGRGSDREERAGGVPSKVPAGPVTAERKSKLVLQPPVTVKTFSIALGIKPSDVIRKLMESKVMATMNTALDDETIQVLALEFGQEVEVRREVDVEKALLETAEAGGTKEDEEERKTRLVPRPPVIAFLGHVDHGKTSLLDAIRQSNVAAGEAGGITQHIGAYQVMTEKGSRITILDTPGHEAFTAMRARGAKTTDIVILVVAADDGVMPQTLEAISHAKAAKVPIIIALNKIDKGDANPQKVRQQLASADLAPEDWGGTAGIVETSATKKIGIQALLERVSLEAELLDLKSDPGRTAIGTVLEASITEGRGIVAHLLVQDGTLKKGDVILAGTGYGKVRNTYNDRGEEVEGAGPSTPVEVSGLSALPQAGDRFYVVPDLAQARAVSETRSRKQREQLRTERPAVSLENLFDRIKAGETNEIQIILKTDVQGSLEALKKEIESLKGKEVGIKLLHAAVGGINESDIDLAYTSDAVLLGFSVIADEKARQKADRQKVEIRTYQIIYEMLDDLRKAMEGMLKPTIREAVTGHATIRKVFRISKVGNIAGCHVSDGSILRSNPVRLIRSSVVIYSGRLASLKRVKDDVREVKAGFECGIRIESYEDIKEGDVIESYEIKEEKRTLA